MASKTKKLEFIRSRKKTKKGQERKAALRNKGTTKSQAELFGDK
jgi:hypothetical protein